MNKKGAIRDTGVTYSIASEVPLVRTEYSKNPLTHPPAKLSCRIASRGERKTPGFHLG